MESSQQLPDTAPLLSEGQQLVTRAASLAITSHAEFEAAGEMLRSVVALRKSITEKFAGPKKAAHEAHKRITALESEMLEAPTKAEGILKRTMGDYQLAEEKRRKKEESRIQAGLIRDEEDRRIAEAEQLERTGNAAVAESIIAAPMPAPLVSLPKPKAAGVTTRKVFKFQITDETKVNRKFLLIDESKIRALVARLGKDAEEIVGGIQVYEDSQIAVGGKR